MSTVKPIRVVVASDQDVYRRGLAALVMSMKGAQLAGEARDEEDAYQLCERIEPDLILLDFKVPLESGRFLAQRIHLRWQSIKVILMAGAQEGIQVQGDLHSNLACTFSRDISEEEFIAALQHIARERVQPENDAASLQSPQPVETYAETRRRRDRTASSVRAPGLTGPRDGEIIARELVTAGRIQADILPEHPPALPGWEITAKLEPALETSGDFYDFIPLVNRNWGIVVADVTDKGMGAALFMALSNTLIRTFAVRYPTLPAIAMDAVNDRILSDTRGSMFVTAFFGVLEPHTGRFRYANAGHPPAILVRSQKSKPVERLRTTGMALGLEERAHWGQKVVRLAPGDMLVLYTDGITEAQNPQGRFFGEQNLVEVIRSKYGFPAHEIQASVLDEVHRFVGGTPRQDDIALIVICRRE
jgi:serine phosphatase RsbU (regulator of sigma subunit)